jgi:uncharacterized protein YcfJ
MKPRLLSLVPQTSFDTKGKHSMRHMLFALTAAALVVPASVALPVSKAEAKRHHHRYSHERGYRHAHRCRYSSGTTGLVAGGVGGALLGNSVLGHGALGTIAGGVGGAFAGRAIDRTITAKHRCR